MDDATAGAETFLFRVDGEVALGDNARFTNTLYNFTATRNWQNAEGYPYCHTAFDFECAQVGGIQRYNGFFYVDHDQDLIGNRAQLEVSTPLASGLENSLVIGAEATRLDFERSKGYRMQAPVVPGDYVDLLNPTPGSYGPRELVGVSPTFMRTWAVFLEDSLPVSDRFRPQRRGPLRRHEPGSAEHGYVRWPAGPGLQLHARFHVGQLARGVR